MDNRQSALFRESLATEERMRAKWLAETDVSSAKPIPPEVMYRSSSITQEPLNAKLVVTTKGFKPSNSLEHFVRAKHSFGMCASGARMFDRVKTFTEVPPELRPTEYYGKPCPTKLFYRRNGAFQATEEHDTVKYYSIPAESLATQ
eukprot:GEMP01087144.1.p1 GENE.GEMP01087144.1~~GEMP01087144.1.p1  ORF type:complete len:146 (+),score=29.42 GEMP01087144.1:199-636(+)